ncbi:hypothetical protein KY285_012870 [Solanum tuberosum]|nr:hypothetical protein KY285_012870 [Solanum tuberosum]
MCLLQVSSIEHAHYRSETAARGAQQYAVNNPPRVVEEHEGVEEITPPHRQPLDPRGVKFTITSTMIQLLNLKGMFRGTAGDDAHQHVMNFVVICKSHEIPVVSQTAMRLRLFPLSLTVEAINGLNEMADDSITTWNELKEAILEQFYHESQELQMKDEISTHKQQLGEAMHDTWWTFNQKLNKCLNHEIMQIMDKVSKNNRAWHTRYAEVGDLGFIFELSA